MEDGELYDYLVYFMYGWFVKFVVTWYIYGYFVYFSQFGMLTREWSGIPGW
jgi:hypothetical protein